MDRANARDVWPGHIDRELRRRRAIRSIQVFCCKIHHGVQLFRVVCVPRAVADIARCGCWRNDARMHGRALPSTANAAYGCQ
ncbi:hypothetical protein D3C71_1623010 [compost metagenome]